MHMMAVCIPRAMRAATHRASFYAHTYCRSTSPFSRTLSSSSPAFLNGGTASSNRSGESSVVRGAATVDATRRFRQRVPKIPSATFPKTGLAVSCIGFGGFRIRPETDIHKQALVLALESGINLIDTSAHFGNGLSELLIGDAIREVTASGVLSREELVVVSKAGFVVGKPSNPFPGHVQVTEALGHCISPEFIEAEITNSLDRLGLDTIDVYMLNNPERLLHANRETSANTEYVYDAIVKACAALDKEVARGRIGSYGISSNSMHISTLPVSLSLRRVIQDLDNASLLTNLSCVQAPFNMLEIDAVVGGDEDDASLPLLRSCVDHDLFLMTQRPLYAICDGKIRLLATPKGKSLDDEGAATSQLAKLFEVTSGLESDLGTIFTTQELDKSLMVKFVWSEVFAENLARLTDNQFAAEHYFGRQVIPTLSKDLQELIAFTRDLSDEEKEAVQRWSRSYTDSVKSLLNGVLDVCRARAAESNMDLNRMMASSSLGSLSSTDALSVNAMRVALSMLHHATPAAMSSVLVGMREPAYVDEVVAAATQPRLSADALEALYDSGILRNDGSLA